MKNKTSITVYNGGKGLKTFARDKYRNFRPFVGDGGVLMLLETVDGNNRTVYAFASGSWSEVEVEYG